MAIEPSDRPTATKRWPRRLWVLAVASGAALAVAIMALVAALDGSSRAPRTHADDSVVSAEFGPNYAGLPGRLQRAGLPTMATAATAAHSHQSLAVYVNGQQVPVPENVGIDPTANGGDMAGLHTHIPGYTIHNEGVRSPTLGQFFVVWGVTLSSSQLGFSRAGSGERVRLWVNGKPSALLGRHPLKDGQRLVVALAPADAPAPPEPPQPDG